MEHSRKIEFDSSTSPEFIKETVDIARKKAIDHLNKGGDFILLVEKFDDNGTSTGVESQICVKGNPMRWITFVEALMESKGELMKSVITSIVSSMGGKQ